MKLYELDARRLKEQVAKVFESQHGTRIDFGRLNSKQAQNMLKRVRGLLGEHRASPSFHYSERNADYMKLVMMEQALASVVKEAPMGQVAPGATATGITPQQMGMQIAQRKKQLQDQLKTAQEQVRTIQGQLSQPNLGMAENRIRKLRESEVQQAQVVLAAQDMVDQLQKMLEQISEMQFKDLPALTDSIRNDMGVDQATQFQADATAALTTLLASVQAGKTQLEAAQGVLTGQAPQVPGAMPGADAGMPPVEPGAEIDANLDIDATVPADDEEDETLGVSLGRERR